MSLTPCSHCWFIYPFLHRWVLCSRKTSLLFLNSSLSFTQNQNPTNFDRVNGLTPISLTTSSPPWALSLRRHRQRGHRRPGNCEDREWAGHSLGVWQHKHCRWWTFGWEAKHATNPSSAARDPFRAPVLAEPLQLHSAEAPIPEMSGVHTFTLTHRRSPRI